MEPISKKNFIAIGLATLALACSLAAAQEESSSQTPASPSRFSSMFDPIVQTGVSELGGRKVNVHLPAIFDLKLDTRANNQGVRMYQSVMSGLVQIFLDRTRDPTSRRLSGPISVKVGGITMYQNEEARGLAQNQIASLL